MKEILTNLLRQYVGTINKTAKWYEYWGGILARGAPAVAVDNRLIVISGLPANGYLEQTSIQAYDVTTKTKAEIGGAQVAKSDYGAATTYYTKEEICTFGGVYNGIVITGDKSDMYNARTGAQRTFYSIPFGAAGYSCCNNMYQKDSIYIYGGLHAIAITQYRDQYICNTFTGSCSSLGGLPFDVREWHHAASIERYNFLLCQYAGVMYYYDALANAFGNVGLPVAMPDVAHIVARGSEIWILVTGKMTYIFNTATWTWRSAANSASTHARGSAVVCMNDVYVLGGSWPSVDRYTETYIDHGSTNVLKVIRDLTLMLWEEAI